MDRDEILKLVDELHRLVGPDTELRWRRPEERETAFWYPDDNANFALQRLLEAWRVYRAEKNFK